ncbi:MAG: hypothetical protein MUE99_05130 [Chitinophagaceae bacterium]|nr:hypothetical protein [Chitinophagaceae bacterium]
MQHAISWFEIPTKDLDRATKFYETIFGISLIPLDMENIKMRMFPVEDMANGIGKTQISSEYGFIGVMIDTEGNRIGLHSNPV